jgi:hypothetical protein
MSKELCLAVMLKAGIQILLSYSDVFQILLKWPTYEKHFFPLYLLYSPDKEDYFLVGNTACSLHKILRTRFVH